jgi:hypothetical protein
VEEDLVNQKWLSLSKKKDETKELILEIKKNKNIFENEIKIILK